MQNSVLEHRLQDEKLSVFPFTLKKLRLLYYTRLQTSFNKP